MKKVKLTAVGAVLSLTAMANGELVTTATTLENEKVIAEAADTANWTFPCSVGINANQAYFNDYSTEGSGASLSLDAFLNLNANYKKNKSLWENSLAAKYGMIYSTEFTGDDKVRKNIDELILNTKYGYKISRSWYISAFANMETQFAKGFAAGLGVDDDITSPTFTILLEYVGDEMPLLHFDLYRLETERELEDIDFAGMLESGAVSLVEWGDKFPDALPEERLDVFIYVVEDGTRRVEVHGRGQRGLELEQMF